MSGVLPAVRAPRSVAPDGVPSAPPAWSTRGAGQNALSHGEERPMPCRWLSKWRHLACLAGAELLAMTLWFSASAVVPQLTAEWDLSGSQQAWLTMSVQIGFIVGAVLSAALNLADRLDSRYLFAVSAFVGALLNAAIAVLEASVAVMLGLRVLTGITLAGVYPPGMRLMATWCKEDRGLGIGLLVGALTLGSAMPHLLNALPLLGASGLPPWRSVVLTASTMAIVGAGIGGFCVKAGPFVGSRAPFHWRFAVEALRSRPARLVNFGYLGHMWELYAMWVWAPMFLLASYERAAWSLQAARLAAFGVIAVGAAGCIFAGLLADRVGRTTVTIGSLVVSGSCALTAGLLFTEPGMLTALCLAWGFAVVADSAQFSAAISELVDPRYVGTALTVQMSLGFTLTLLTIQLIPPLVKALGWEYVFMILAIGPALGAWNMFRLRQLPEALALASGHR
jgi:MFS family permease